MDRMLWFLSQDPIEIEGGADQGQMRERLGEVSQCFAMVAGLFPVEAYMVGIPQHALEEQSRFIEPPSIFATGASKRLHEPK